MPRILDETIQLSILLKCSSGLSGRQEERNAMRASSRFLLLIGERRFSPLAAHVTQHPHEEPNHAGI